ncbi:hypothetical protein [Bacillus pumilus]|uniref:hypothetical protein n=1 Tax=Bacillus pumilus TaxID=1408 RepID=UPI00119F8328|nr:hypothetical protein [Bacillus pumilus]
MERIVGRRNDEESGIRLVYNDGFGGDMSERGGEGCWVWGFVEVVDGMIDLFIQDGDVSCIGLVLGFM